MTRAKPHLDGKAGLDQELATWREVATEADRVEDADAEALAQLRSGVEARIRREHGLRAKLRSLVRWQRLAWLTALSLLLLGGVVALTPRADLAAYPLGRMALVLAALMMGLVAAGWRLFRPLHQPAPSPAGALALAGGAVVGVFVLLALPVSHVGAPAGQGGAFWVACLKCAAWGGALGLPVGLAAAASRRSATGGASVAALVGTVAALAGNLCLQLHCPITDVAHLLLGHAPLAVLFTGAAAALSLQSRQLLR